MIFVIFGKNQTQPDMFGQVFGWETKPNMFGLACLVADAWPPTRNPNQTQTQTCLCLVWCLENVCFNNLAIIATRNISLAQRDLHFLRTHSLAKHTLAQSGPEHFIMECRTGNIFDCSMTVLDDYIFSLFDHNQIQYYTIKIWLWSKM